MMTTTTFCVGWFPRTVVVVVLLFLQDSSHGFSTPSAASSSTTMQQQQEQFIGVDLGTSGARISVIDDQQEEVYTQAVLWKDYGDYDQPQAWTKAVHALMQGASENVSSLAHVRSICISGTSASCLLVDSSNNTPTRGTAARMYNYNVDNKNALDVLDKYAPPRHTARSPTGSLAKLLAWQYEKPLSLEERLCHQSDYVTRHFLSENDDDASKTGMITSDWHNCLKLGYDVRNLEWPTWLLDCLDSTGMESPQNVLPGRVVSPGEPIGKVKSEMAEMFGLSPNTVLVGGTTDSNAAFFAATAQGCTMGTAVTSLGSTLAIKQLSQEYVEDADKGVYSHRFPSVFGGNDIGDDDGGWLVGGASNVGCLVLRELGFSNEELVALSEHIDPNVDSPLHYYPLTKKGERFPVADSEMEPVLEPRPDDRAEFLHGILQGISDVERDGFAALGALGASPNIPDQVWTCGGGSRNDKWSALRQRRLREAFGTDSISVARAENVEASYGAAILATASFR